jgi:DNA polymerase-3 subunit alpha
MAENPFVHLHVHTEFSLLDGLSKIPKLIERGKALEMPAMAITDHGTMFGVIDFYRKAKSAGIKPILGVESYLAPRSMYDRDSRLDRNPFHLLLLAKNQTGYRNLLKIASAAQLEGFYGRPRIDRDFLAQHAEGLIATSGCLAAQVPQKVMEANYDEARELIDWYLQVFGRENFYLELQQHDIAELRTVNEWLIEISRRDQIPLVATNDVHYVLETDYDPHDTLLCIQTSTTKDDAKRLRMTDNSYFLASAQQMWTTFGHVLDGDPLWNTLRIAEMCEVNLDDKQYHLPVFPVPEGHNSRSYLRYLCEKGLQWRFGADADNALYRERLDYELETIGGMGFETYFLIVWDLCEFARQADIWWNVRGSGAGSLAAYCLGITNINPVENNLLFERFLNPGRVSMPDIDLDYPDDRRMEMIDYTVRKYGEDKVAAIITFGTLGAKAAVRDVGRALGVDLDTVNAAARLIPTEPKPKPVHQYVEDNPELKALYQNDKKLRQVIDTAAELQGVSRHVSTHAAGVIVADKPLVEYLPLHRQTKDDLDSALKQVTQFPMETCESIGLLKVDFLGLSTLTIMRRASDLIKRYHGVEMTMDTIPYRPTGDPKLDQMLAQTFEMISRGETIGVFQVESTGMQQMLREMRPTKFEHIVAAVSLYRPGPMDYIPEFNARMHGDHFVEYHHPRLEPILAETYGIMVYQEQIMQIASAMFGYSLGEADLMRRAVSKKKKEDLLKHKEIFIKQGPALDPTVTPEIAERIFDDIEFFANYGFNKSHAADYAVITVQSAFLKTHFPAEYMAALLSVYFDDATKVTTLLGECKRLNIPILPPDINTSQLDFDIQPDPKTGVRGIRFGMAAIKNAGVGALRHIIEAREAGTPFANLNDLCKRVDLRQVGKKTVESLIKVGAFDSLKAGTRPQLLAVIDRIISTSANHYKAADVGQMDMFGGGAVAEDDLLTNLPHVQEASPRDMLNWERELLGIFVSSHPIDPIVDSLSQTNVTPSHILKDIENNGLNEKPVRFIGLVVGIRKMPTKSREMMAVITLEDRFGTIDAVLFPRTWAKYGELVSDGAVLVISGKLDASRGDPQILCELITTSFETMTPISEPGEIITDIRYESGTAAGEMSDAVADSTPAAPSSGEPPSLDELPPEWDGYDTNGDVILASDSGEYAANGNGHHHGNGSGRPPLTIVIRCQWDGDEMTRLEKLLKRVNGLLTKYAGKDHFRIIITQNGQDRYEMNFDTRTTHFNERLKSELQRIPGVHITVED